MIQLLASSFYFLLTHEWFFFLTILCKFIELQKEVVKTKHVVSPNSSFLKTVLSLQK